MRRLAVLVLLCGAACQEPPKTPQMVGMVRGLVDLHTWDPATEGAGQWGYDAVMGSGPEVYLSLAAHITDETPTALYDRVFDIKVTLGDVCFYLLLKLTKADPKPFAADGAFITTQLPNPIFCIRWKDGMASRRRAQARFVQLLTPPDTDR